MRKNFIAMPPLLKLLTMVTAGVPLFSIRSMFPSQVFEVFGRQMTVSEWWFSGAGLTVLVAGCFMIIAALLMLKRSRYGRPMYILGWILMSLSIPLIAYVVRADFSTAIPSLISNLVLTAFIGFYLYKSRAINHYFANDTVTR